MISTSRRSMLFCLLNLGLVVSVFAESVIDQSDYMPLSEGDEWTMDAEIVKPNGEIVIATAKRRIGERVEKDGKVYQRTHTWSEGKPFSSDSTKLMRKDDTGLYSMAEQKGAKEETEIALPLKVGQSWKRLKGQKLVTTTVIGIESVMVNGKTYENCFHIRSTTPDGSFTEDYWEAAKVGSVKSEMVGSNGLKMTLTLKEFKSGK